MRVELARILPRCERFWTGRDKAGLCAFTANIDLDDHGSIETPPKAPRSSGREGRTDLLRCGDSLQLTRLCESQNPNWALLSRPCGGRQSRASAVSCGQRTKIHRCGPHLAMTPDTISISLQSLLLSFPLRVDCIYRNCSKIRWGE